MIRYILILITLAFSLHSFAQFDAEIIEDFSYYQVKSSKLNYRHTRVIQINNRDGDKYAELVIPYSKGDKVTLGEIWIEDMNGNLVRKLKNKEVTDRSYISSISLYEDDFVKTCDLKHNVYPYRVICNYEITYSRFLRIESFNYDRMSLPVRKGILNVEVPAGYPIQFVQENIEKPQVDTYPDATIYNWTYSYEPISKTREVNESVNSFTAPYIDIVPVNFSYGIEGSQKTWSDFGAWIYNLNKGQDELPISGKIAIDELLLGARSEREKAERLYKYLQGQNRYINVSINLGGLKTYPASYVVANRYGDCKALTNYMQAMLKYAGIKSYYTLIQAGSKVRDVNPDFASQVFNHVILTIPFEKETIFLECTSKNSPFGYLGTFTQGREALLINPTGSKLIQIPSLTEEDVLCTRTIEVDLNTSTLELNAKERGEQYEGSDYLANKASKNTVDKYIRNNLFKGSFDLIDFKLESTPNLPETSLWAKSTIHNLYKKYGNNVVIMPCPIYVSAYEAPEMRKTDVQLDYPEYYKDTIIYDMGDLQIKSLPKDMTLETQYGIYNINYTQEGNKVIQSKTISINKGRYPIDDYGNFYKFVSTIKSNELKNIYIEIQ